MREQNSNNFPLSGDAIFPQCADMMNTSSSAPRSSDQHIDRFLACAVVNRVLSDCHSLHGGHHEIVGSVRKLARTIALQRGMLPPHQIVTATPDLAEFDWACDQLSPLLGSQMHHARALGKAILNHSQIQKEEGSHRKTMLDA